MATVQIADERAFSFLRVNSGSRSRGPKGCGNPWTVLHTDGKALPRGHPRHDGQLCGFTEVRRRVLHTHAASCGGEIINLCHQHDVLVSTGGFLEQVLMQGKDAVKGYIRECNDLGFDTIEISSGFITLPADDWLRLVEQVQKAERPNRK